MDEKVTSLEEDLAQAALEAEADRGSSPQDEAAAELQPILSRHANAAGLRSHARVQHLDWIRACSDVEPLPGGTLLRCFKCSEDNDIIRGGFCSMLPQQCRG